MALTALQVKNAKSGMHSDGNGLYLSVKPSGARAWVFRFQLNHRRREMGLGAGLSLVEARAEAAACAKLVGQGIDPIEHRNASKAATATATKAKATTFGDAASDYIDSQREGWKNPKHIAQWGTSIATYAAAFYGKPVADVTLDDLEAALRPIWSIKSETATRVMCRIVLVMQAAQERNLCSGDYDAWAARLYRRLPKLPAKAKRVTNHPALPFDRMPAFMAALKAQPGQGARALEFAIHCASRSGEVRGMVWGEVDLAGAAWTIPGERMKVGTPHRVPLSKAAVALLQAIGEGKPDALVFPGDRSKLALSDMTLSAVIRRMNGDAPVWVDEHGAPVVPHGFRATFSTWCSETTPYPADVREMALAHAISNKVEAAYRRGELFEKRRALMAEWSQFIE